MRLGCLRDIGVSKKGEGKRMERQYDAIFWR